MHKLSETKNVMGMVMEKTEKQLEDYDILHYTCNRVEQLSYLEQKTKLQRQELAYKLCLLQALGRAAGSERQPKIIEAMRRYLTPQIIEEVEAYITARRMC